MIAANDTDISFLTDMAPDQLRRVIAHAGGLLAHHTSNAESAQVLSRVAARIEGDDPRRTMRGILETVALRYGVTTEALISPGYKSGISIPRQEAMWLMRQVTWRGGRPRYSYPKIGAFLGGRDWSTIIYGVKRHAERLAASAEGERA